MRRLTQPPETAGAVVIRTVEGMAGTGKTTLATHAAHLLSGRYPDAQLFVRFSAYTPGHTPADPYEVLSTLLLLTGTPPGELPPALDGRSQQWRDWLADKSVLLVLDDVGSEAQIEPLLPGVGDSMVIVTSRNRLFGAIDADFVELDTLPPSDAVDLFVRSARLSPVHGETELVARLVHECGCLPLAIVLLASRLRRGTWELAEFAAHFRGSLDQSSELGVPHDAVFGAFEMSYGGLPAARQRLFRFLGVHPGSDTDVHATAALADCSLAQARTDLEALYEDHLIKQPTPGRYRFHDLIRSYARRLADQDPEMDRAQAVGRLLTHYLRTAEAAGRRLSDTPVLTSTPSTSEVPDASSSRTPGPDSDYEKAMAWMRTERANLLACTRYAAGTARDHPLALRLIAAQAPFLRLQGPWDEALTLHESAATMARAVRDGQREADALWEMGRIRYLAADYPAALAAFERNLDKCRSLENGFGEANALVGLARVHTLAGNPSSAAESGRQAAEIYRALNSCHGEADALWAVGVLHNFTGVPREADAPLRQALELYHTLGHRHGEADALRELGRTRCLSGDYEEATALVRQALELAGALGDIFGEANALRESGIVLTHTGDLQEATACLHRALDLYRALGHRHGEAIAARDLAVTLTHEGRLLEAADQLRWTSDRFERLGDTLSHARVVLDTARLLILSGEWERSRVVYEQGLAAARRVHSPLDEGRAHEGLSRCLARAGARETALAHLSEAVAIYRRIGSAEASSAADRLNHALSRRDDSDSLLTDP